MNLDEWFDRTSNAATGVIQHVLEHLGPGRTFVDVGANVGAVTHAALQAGARVLAFEPVPTYFDYLVKRCPDARAWPYALGADFGSLPIWCDDMNLGWNTMVAKRAEPGMKRIDVEVRPLDWLELETVKVMKIDVEGYEADVIAGAAQTIQRCKPAIVMELGWGTNHPNWEGQVRMMEWLFDQGYERVKYDFEGTQDVVLTRA